MKPQYQETNTKMEKTRQALQNEFAAIRASAANVAVLDKISVDYWGVKTPIQQVATVSVQEGKTLLIQPYDTSLLKTIEKAIQISDLGINPQNDGRIIRLDIKGALDIKPACVIMEPRQQPLHIRKSLQLLQRSLGLLQLSSQAFQPFLLFRSLPAVVQQAE